MGSRLGDDGPGEILRADDVNGELKTGSRKGAEARSRGWRVDWYRSFGGKGMGSPEFWELTNQVELVAGRRCMTFENSVTLPA